MQKKNEMLKKVAIAIGIILGLAIIITMGFYLFVMNKIVDAKYGQLPFRGRIEKISEIITSFVNTEILKNAPACNSPEVEDIVSQIMREKSLVDGESVVRWIDVGGDDGVRAVVGKLYYSEPSINGITLEDTDKDVKKNVCSANLTYRETLNEDGKMGDENRKLVYTDYSCRISYETQVTLDGGDIQVVMLEKQCKQGTPEVEENDD